MTTNAGSDNGSAVVGFTGMGEYGDNAKTEKALSRFLRPEFINRVDEIITFRALDKNDFASIAKIMLSELKAALAEKAITLNFTDEAAALIAEESFSAKYGARNMRRYIQKNVEDKLAEEIISDYGHSITRASLYVLDGKLTVACM